MAESVYASKAKVGEHYVTKGGYPVTVVSIGNTIYGKPGIIVKVDTDNSRVAIYADQLLFLRGSKPISQEAIAMAKSKTENKPKGNRGGERGAEKTKDGIRLFREWKGVTYEALVHDGVVTCKGKDYTALVDAVSAIKGSEQRGSGRTFFGLRTSPNIMLGDQVIKELREAQEGRQAAEKNAEKEVKAAQKATKPKKAKKAKPAEDDDEDEAAPRTVADVVAKVMGKGRK